MFETHDIVGTTGVAIIIVTYFLLQIGKISSETLTFSLLNAGGSALILYSLSYNWNMASVLIESFWILISLIGLFRVLKKRTRI
ncbi:hypothetical protein [Hydrogenimonas sp.]|uniref:CBU_0592 family membrane protein n=1 Tax=Hydrogenimonas sp. TaxID=2231112 RepID=UPI002614EED4|nr:hypothetical protein [Hydrogenimonas sp.]